MDKGTLPETRAFINSQEFASVSDFDWVIENFSMPEIVQACREYAARHRGKGRPARANPDDILTQCAKAKLKTGRYTQLARRFRMTVRQLRNFVEYRRREFNAAVKRATEK